MVRGPSTYQMMWWGSFSILAPSTLWHIILSHMCIYICIHIYICVCVCTCLTIHTCITIHIYITIYYMYMLPWFAMGFPQNSHVPHLQLGEVQAIFPPRFRTGLRQPGVHWVLHRANDLQKDPHLGGKYSMHAAMTMTDDIRCVPSGELT